ncbi:MAG: NAD(P)H-dependent glycerol-3-phosphate dehydrogenase [Candidatus Aminicenantia bacterium]
MRIAIIGGGAWGTAFSIYLATLKHLVSIWVREKELVEEMKKRRENTYFLPGIKIPENVMIHNEIESALKGDEIVFFAVPSKFARYVLKEMERYKKDIPVLISLTKGIDPESLKRVSEMAEEAIGVKKIGVLSGPSFAKEVAEGKPTSCVVASKDLNISQMVQNSFSSHTLRLYRSSDIIGVELAGALKNVIAIAGGIVVGLGLGMNALASLITRGIVEIAKLGVRMGAEERTFYGLAGIGDLILTCTGELSRNRRYGIELARTKPNKISLGGQIAEGATTAKSVYILSRKLNIEMPITEEVYKIIYEGKDPLISIKDLMGRALKEE